MANISFLVEWFPGGGVERVIMNLAQPLVDRGHKIFLFVHNLQAEKLPAVLPIEYIKLPYSALSSRNYDTVRQSIIDNRIDKKKSRSRSCKRLKGKKKTVKLIYFFKR